MTPGRTASLTYAHCAVSSITTEVYHAGALPVKRVARQMPLESRDDTLLPNPQYSGCTRRLNRACKQVTGQVQWQHEIVPIYRPEDRCRRYDRQR